VQGHPHRNPRVAAHTPTARVGLHQTLANSRETDHTTPKCLGTRAHRSTWNQARTAAARPETQGHALPRAPSLLLSPRHWPRRKPAAPSVAPRRRLAPSGAGARTICHERGRANSRARARCRPATGFDSDASSHATAQPAVAQFHTRCCTFGAPRRAHAKSGKKKGSTVCRGMRARADRSAAGCVCVRARARARACVLCGVPRACTALVEQ
jgi:hypothetical protein